VGAGRVGRTVHAALRRHHLPVVVVEDDRHRAERLKAGGAFVVWGDATRPEVLQAAGLRRARLLVLALPGAVEAREVLRLARAENPGILATVRTHSEEEAAWLEAEGAVHLVLMGEREVALGMADFALQRLGLPAATAQATVDALRLARGAPLGAAFAPPSAGPSGAGPGEPPAGGARSGPDSQSRGDAANGLQPERPQAPG
jgi:CPA2 family monovalent cation:H+ antiporter-2